MNYRVLALDLDGTLTNSKKVITDKTKTAIKNAIEQDVSIVLASGRPVLGIQRLADELRLSELGGYILAYNGGHIIDCKTGKDIVRRIVPREYYQDICECAHTFGVNALTYDDFGVVAESEDAPYVIKEAYNNTIPIRKVENLQRFVDYDVTKFMIVGEPAKLEPALKCMQSKFKGKLSVFLSEPYFTEIGPLGVEKASALGHLLDYLGTNREHLMACGDGLNDIPMLKYAGFAVAMDNAYPETKAVADYISLSNEEDGVAYAINRFILGTEETERGKYVKRNTTINNTGTFKNIV